MIRHDGYYISNSVLIEDSIANYSYKGYSHKAYLFLPDGTYLRAGKKSESTETDFSKSDFNPQFSNKYQIKGNELKMTFETGKEWEFTEIFEIVSPEELIGKERTLRFVSW